MEDPNKKRRGRKRTIKTIDNNNTSQPSQSSIEEPISSKVSQRGRLRKSINYFEIENPSYIESANKKDLKCNKKSKKVINKDIVTAADNSAGCDNSTSDGSQNNSNGILDSLLIHLKVDEQPESEQITYSPIRKKGRPKKKVNSTNKVQDVTDVTCAICENKMKNSSWIHHKQRFHNNLAWRIGENPLDLNDKSFVLQTLNDLYRKKKPLYCYKCKETKKSVMGFLSHQTVCNKSDKDIEDIKVVCNICQGKILPASLLYHLKAHEKPKLKATKKTKNDKELALVEFNSKRKAAKKALNIIKTISKTINDDYYIENLDITNEFVKNILCDELKRNQTITCKFICTFKFPTIEEFQSHINCCNKKICDKYYFCKKCLLANASLSDLRNHLQSVHNIIWDDDYKKDSNFSDVNIQSSTNSCSGTIPNFLNEFLKTNRNRFFTNALSWTLEFRKENYQDIVHPDLLSHWPLLPRNDVLKYLPKLFKSCYVAQIFTCQFSKKLPDKLNFKQFNLFESNVDDKGNITVFCGGAITSIAWLPSNEDKDNGDEEQILAVSVLNEMDKEYLMIENYEELTTIQLWNFGILKNNKQSDFKPTLVAGLVLEYGPIWHLEWCPSGGWYKNQRCGLLAVACSNVEVCIYSIPSLINLKNLFFKPKPVLKLILQRDLKYLLGNIKYYPTKISWSKARNHNFIAVGYTNGMVGLFNLNSNSPLIKQRINDFNYVLPYKYFQAHSHSITALTLHHLKDGCRWLMTGSLDRSVNFWDLNDTSYPINSIKKFIVTDGFWFTNWLCFCLAHDESSSTLNNVTIINQARNYLFENFTILYSSATITSISGSDWLNAIVQGNTVGEVIASFPHQLLNVSDYKFLKAKRKLLSYTLLKDLIGNDYIPLTYRKAKEQFGLVFCDNLMESFEKSKDDLGALSKNYTNMRPDQYPIQAITKISFNPNCQARLYYATAYQAGFIRLNWMNFLQ